MTVHQVWVSRPQNRAAGLVQALTAAGLVPHVISALCITDLPLTLARRQLANAPHELIIFISAEAACRFAAVRKESFLALSVGSATAAAVQEISHAELIQQPSAVSDSEQLLSLPILQAAAIRNKRILVVGGDGGDFGIAPKLCEGLQQRGAVLETLALYCRSAPQLNQNEKYFLQKHAPHFKAAVAYSAETAANMLGMAQSECPHIVSVPLFVIHPNIATAAKRYGWQNPLVAPPDDAGMAKAICDYL